MLFKIIALIEMTAFYACYFAKMYAQKKKGIQTDQMGKGKTGFVKFVEASLKVMTCCVPFVELISIFAIRPILPESIRRLGALLACVGVAVFAISVLTMKDSWRAGVSETEKTELVTNGIYRFSRNPAFLGFDLLYIGILGMFFYWLLLLITLLAMAMFHLQIVNVEEDFLLHTFGDEYIAYKQKVHRYLGRN